MISDLYSLKTLEGDFNASETTGLVHIGGKPDHTFIKILDDSVQPRNA